MNYSNAKYYFLNNKKFWISSPFVKFLISYCIGIFFYKSFAVNPSWHVNVILICTFSFLSFQTSKGQYLVKNQNFIVGFYIAAILFLMGNMTAKNSDPQGKNLMIPANITKISYLTGDISETSLSASSHRYIVDIKMAYFPELKTWKKTIGKILVVSYGEKLYETDDAILFKNKLKEIPATKSAYDVDFKSIYSKKGIFLQEFIKDDNQLTKYGTNTSLFSQLNRAARRVNNFLKQKISGGISPESAGVVNALVLGDKSQLTHNVRHVYAQSGIMHILAVSGLHVGIIYLIIQSLFSFIKIYRGGKWHFLVLTLLILWSFAFVTGMSASVVRATIMFSIFSFGPALGRRNFGFNITATSALIILALDPDALYDVGFQLSYCAVFSIFFFYEDIYKLIRPNSSFLDKIWKLVAVSVAAQLGTLPLVLFYFHTFQPLSPLFNIIAIPFAFLVLTGGLLYLAVCFIPFLSDIIALLVDKSVFFGTHLFESALILSPDLGYLHINNLQVILLYLFLFIISAFLFKRKLLYLLFAVFVLIGFNSITIYNSLKKENQREIMISKRNDKFVADIIIGRNFFSFSNANLDDGELQEQATPKRLKADVDPIPTSSFKSDDFELKVYKQHSYLWIKNPETVLSSGLTFDYVFLSKRISNDQKRYFEQFADTIIYLQAY